jgi:hypothetical protein
MIYPSEKYFSFNQVSNSVPMIKLAGLTKKWLVPGWRSSWIGLFGKIKLNLLLKLKLKGKGDALNEVKKGINNLLSIILMQNTIC